MVAYEGRHVRRNRALRFTMLALGVLLAVLTIGYGGYAIGHATAPQTTHSASAHPGVLAPSHGHENHHPGPSAHAPTGHHHNPLQAHLDHLHHLAHLAHAEVVKHLDHLRHLAHERHLERLDE